MFYVRNFLRGIKPMLRLAYLWTGPKVKRNKLPRDTKSRENTKRNCINNYYYFTYAVMNLEPYVQFEDNKNGTKV
jgi:hypothetical protein